MQTPFAFSFLMSFLLVLVSMAFYTLMERKFMGYFQLRKGPNKVSLMGLPQPFADAIKLFMKEQNKPTLMNKHFYIAAPIVGLILALLTWAIYPHSHPAMFIMFGILYFLCVSSMNVYTTFMSGWCSNSKYALLGALRSIAQTISYEVSMALIMLTALIATKSMDMSTMSMNNKTWVMMMFIPMMVIWFTTNLAETNRTPFDFAEGESELVSGFNTEYSSSMFALIFMAEYTNILLMSLLSVILFTGTTYNHLFMDSFLITKTMFMAMLFVWMRCTLPRMRYDKLMYLTWKSFLPISLAMLLIIIPILVMTWYCAGRTDNSDDVN